MREKINKHINLRLTSDWLHKQRMSEAAGQDGAGTLIDGEHKSIIILSQRWRIGLIKVRVEPYPRLRQVWCMGVTWFYYKPPYPVSL